MAALCNLGIYIGAKHAAIEETEKGLQNDGQKKQKEMIPASHLVGCARDLIGVRWLHQGRSRTGVDCIGLVLLAAKEAGLDLLGICGLTDKPGYGREPNSETPALLREHLFRLEAPEPGALIVFNFSSTKDLPKHFGLFTDTDTMIHAYAKFRRVSEDRLAGLWARHLHSVWRLPGVTYGA